MLVYNIVIMNYLENSICTFKPLFDIDYTKKKNIISTVFFRLEGGEYKSLDKYLNGIKELHKFYKNNLPNFHIRMFIDNSIYSDKK